METIQTYLFQIAVTGAISLGATAYLRPHLRRILTELCGTTERAQFWVVFSSILLVGLPLIIGLGYNPMESASDSLFFDAAGQVRANMIGFVLALLGIGATVSFFALVAPRPTTK
jgi:uncharacterized membrane protein YhaH (DUF805 family)